MAGRADLYLLLLSWYIFMEFGEGKISKKNKWRTKIAALIIFGDSCWRFYSSQDLHFSALVLFLSIIIYICSEVERK